MDLSLPSDATTLCWVRLLLTGGLALVLGDAALDKFRDWSGNAGYVKQVFAKSALLPLAVPLLAVLATLMTLGALACLGGVVQLLFGWSPGLAWAGALFAALTFLGLLFGLQIGKNHEAAKGVTIYFALSVLTLWSLRG